MPVDNPFTRIARRYNWLPDVLRRPLVSRAVGRTICFVGTAGLRIETLTATRVVVRLPDARRVHNHIGGLHASAMALLAETTTGLIVAMNVPSGSAPVLRSMQADYRRRASGALRAEATLSDAEAERIQSKPIGKITPPVHLEDARGRAPLEVELQWAWLPKERALRE